MDKATIKNYAIEARKKLIAAVKQKAKQLYIFEDSQQAISHEEALERLKSADVFLTSGQERARLRLVTELIQQGSNYEVETYNRLMENIAYTWFNRLIALRFMEVNNYLPSKIRILSSKEQGRIEPDALREVELLDYVDTAIVAKIQASKDFNAPEQLYRHILIAQCNKLSEILPSMFQELDDYTELLLPDTLFSAEGVVHDLVNSIHEDNFSINNQGQIEIIGWLYQYYTSEKKDEVFAALKKNVKLNKDTIPAATQLFTPEWIVKYMVENSLGRIWLEGQTTLAYGSASLAEKALAELKTKWKYYIDEAEQEPDVAEQLRQLRAQSPIKRPEDIKFIDPCMGSGHILVYAFDVLYQIYESVGYSVQEIPNLILQHNIHGLDIDDRAGQLAYFALMMKARGYNRRFFRQAIVPQPMVHSAGNDLELSEYGSLVKVDEFEEKPQFPEKYSLEHVEEVVRYERKMLSWQYRRLLAQKYDVVITNPPYMGSSGMGMELTKFVKENYPDSKSDLCVAFIERNFSILKKQGFLSMITMHSWMFLSSYEKFREKLLNTKGIVNMAHLGTRAFEEISGEVVQTTAFITTNQNIADYVANYTRLVDFNNQFAKEEAFLAHKNIYVSKQENFKKIPSFTIAYWLSEKIVKCFENVPLSEYSISDGQTKTGDNDKYLRLLWEVNNTEIGQTSKWAIHVKGGSFRRWYGNIDTLINWSVSAREHYRKDRVARIAPEHIWFRKGVSWSLISGNERFAVRLLPKIATFNLAAPSIFLKEVDLTELVIGFLNSPVAEKIMRSLNPTINTNIGDVTALPLIISPDKRQVIEKLVLDNIELSRNDWDSFETSWDFVRHPLLNGEKSLKDAFAKWEADCNTRFDTLKANEEELNRIFIDIYGLQDELTPNVEDKDVTIRKADLVREIRSFISYAVGCMFGRYSLDEQGLVFAGGNFEPERYKTLKPVTKNILMFNTINYFEDDIVLRFVEFVRAAYGEDTLSDNLDFIANVLYPDTNGTTRERIRRYFLNDFYKDHVKIYQKRPIYWLMDSGKKDGFKALFYLHRYDKYTLARARGEYLHPLQRKYDAEIKRLEATISRSDEPKVIANCRKQITSLKAQYAECRNYDQIAAYLSYQNIELDLDDGIKVNYAKFQGVEVPKDDGKIEKMDLLGRI